MKFARWGLAVDLRQKMRGRDPPLNRKCSRFILVPFNQVNFLILTDFRFTFLSGRHIPVNHEGREIVAHYFFHMGKFCLHTSNLDGFRRGAGTAAAPE